MEQKKEIMRNRRNITEKGMRIEDGLTWKERKIKWRLEEIAGQERVKEKKM